MVSLRRNAVASLMLGSPRAAMSALLATAFSSSAFAAAYQILPSLSRCSFSPELCFTPTAVPITRACASHSPILIVAAEVGRWQGVSTIDAIALSRLARLRLPASK